MNENIDRVYSMDISELWKETARLYHEREIDFDTYNDSKLGLHSPKGIHFDIRIYIKYEDDERYVRLRPKNKQIKINGRVYSKFSFDDEMERRESIMRTALLEYYDEQENPTKSR